MSTLHDEMIAMGDLARAAARRLAVFSTAQKNAALLAMAEALEADRAAIKAANAQDMAEGRADGLTAALLDRLELTDQRIDAMVAGIQQIVDLKDPVGAVLKHDVRADGLVIDRVRVPIGVIAMVYESRPNVTADAGALCMKAGNAVILRGGKEAKHSNRAIAAALVRGGEAAGLPSGALQLVQSLDRDAVRELAQMVGRVDMIIPRGGEGLIRAVTEMARVPVIKHDKGVCHVFVDKAANLDMALEIADNAKTQRPGVCNAMETLLVHRDVAGGFLPRLTKRLAEKGVELRGDEAARAVSPEMKPATAADWDEEYLDLILAVRGVVDDVNAAIEHIAQHGSNHSDAIVSEDAAAQSAFLQQVDSAAVYVNASTRFTDGAQFGMGAEIGISTDKLHARGPMGIDELCTYKFVVRGTGHIVR